MSNILRFFSGYIWQQSSEEVKEQARKKAEEEREMKELKTFWDKHPLTEEGRIRQEEVYKMNTCKYLDSCTEKDIRCIKCKKYIKREKLFFMKGV
jgi:hypothetical protein